MSRHSFAALLVAALAAAPASSMGLCVAEPRTFREDAADSKLIVYATPINTRGLPNNGTLTCLVLGVVKPHRVLGKQKFLAVEAAPDINNPPRWLVFCDVAQGRIDPYRGVETGPAVVGYLKGLLALDAKNPIKRLRYCFRFLDHPDKAIAADARLEFTKAPEREVGQAARNFRPDKLRRRLMDPKTPDDQLPLYAFLLGNCGAKADGALLRALATKLLKEPPHRIDRFLTACTLLDPKGGWSWILELLGDPANDFRVRYAALRAVRFFHDTRPDVVANKDLVAAMRLGLRQDDMDDLVIEELRTWRCWQLTARILPAYSKRSSTGLIRRAVLRYALQCPGPEAGAFIADRRKADPESVADAKELLELEKES
jgi:hypothetical protein